MTFCVQTPQNTFLFYFFTPAPKSPALIQLIILYDYQIIHEISGKLKPVNVWHFCMITDCIQ